MPPRLPRTLAPVPCSFFVQSSPSSRPCVNRASAAASARAHSHGRCRPDSASYLASSAAAGLRLLRCRDDGSDGGGFGARRSFHASPRHLRRSAFEGKNHYERLKVSTDATPAEIKKSFYALSKAHHPDANHSDPDAAHNFALLSESYTVLSDASRRATYDRDVLRLHEQHARHHAHHHPHGSYHSTNPAGGRPPSGLSRRRGTFRGPPPSFYRSGGWGAHAEKRHQAHEESTGGASSGSSAAAGDAGPKRANPWDTGAFHHAQSSSSSSSSYYGGMGPGSSPFRDDDDRDVPPHFDRAGHTRTHERQDRRRWQRQRRAFGDDGIEFEPQTSLAGHFLIVAGILAATFVAPAVYLQFMRLGRRKQEKEA
ncbi:hypothetical protein J3F83DRAFT_711548 [Trichoderma novae-zelandiae]